MSVNSSDRKILSQCEVRSKYFTEGPVMDESLSNFQEKKNFVVPKKPEKVSINNKPKKTIKRIKGQKDIRSALKSMKNELVTYANDFNKVCKQSGIDVDSEQLQLAIALSKSLQQTEGIIESTSSQSSGSLTCQERTGKIRTTLLEYGFKVPEIKVTAKRSRKLKKHRKTYKLLLASEAEKQQVISDRYSQVLFQNINNIYVENCNINKISESNIPLCHIATGISYKKVKDINTFYVKDLIEANHEPAGSLLKDWSQIPGRPATPQTQVKDIKFNDIDCSQEELDIILAGTLESAQQIVNEKYKFIKKEVELHFLKSKIVQDSKTDLIMDSEIFKSHKSMSCDLSKETNRPMENSENIVNHPVMIMDTESPQKLSVISQVRCCSPDIFDDEVSSIIDVSKANADGLSQENPCKDVTKSNFMDLTECVNSLSQRSLHTVKTMVVNNSKMLSQPSQDENVTKRRSNDFMEITECVPTFSSCAIQKVDLSQNSIQCYSLNIDDRDKKIKSIDLTQSSDSNDSLPFVQINGTDKILDDTIILNENVCLGVMDVKSEIIRNSKPLNVNKSESYATDNVLTNPNTLLGCIDGENSLVLIDYESDNDESKKDSKKQINCKHEEDQRSKIRNKPKESVSKCESFYEDFVHPHSESSKEHSEDGILCVNDSPNNSIAFVNASFNKPTTDYDNLDLTQIPSTSIEKDSIINVKSNKQFEDESYSARQENNIVNNCTSDNKITKNDIDLTQSSGSSVETPCKAFVENEMPFQNKISLTERYHISEENKCLFNDIDLTQSAESSSEEIEPVDTYDIATTDHGAVTKVSDTNSLGKIGDVSIDYDELFDDMIASHTNHSNSYKSATNLSQANDSTEKPRRTHSISNSSKNSDVFEISDNELNYSIDQSRQETANRNFDIGGLSIMNDLSKASGSRLIADVENSREPRVSISDSFLPEVYLGGTKYSKANNVVESKGTPLRNVINKHKICTKTPANSDYIIKTDQVTPMVDYESLTTPERNRELDKYGLKPFKRKRAIQLLTHLYNQTHPIVESCSIEDLPSPSKKQKKNDYRISNTQVHLSPKKYLKSPAKSKGSSPREWCEAPNTEHKDVLEERNKENEDVYRVTNEAPEIKNIECVEDDWVFQKREKAKLHSCRVPLHIAFHNYVSCRRGLLEAILRYEPVNIDVIHRGLVESGHKYDAKDLLKFMDRKCITVKTADNNAKINRKRY